MKGQSKSVSTALARKISDSLTVSQADEKTHEALEFIKKVITPQLPEDTIDDPNDFTDFLRAQSAVQYRIKINLYFLIYMFCYNPIIVSEELATYDEMFEIGDMIYRWQLLKDYDGNRFAGVSEFINWLSGEIGSSRATVWRKISLIRNILGLGINLEDAYEIFSLGSFSVNNVLKSLGDFREGKLVEISPVIAERFIVSVKTMDSDRGELVESLWEKSTQSQKHYAMFISEALSYVRNIVSDFKDFEEPSELRQWENTIVLKPEYKFRIHNDALLVEVVYFRYDRESDVKYVDKVVKEILIPTSTADGSLSDDIIRALDKHLPLRRRTMP